MPPEAVVHCSAPVLSYAGISAFVVVLYPESLRSSKLIYLSKQWLFYQLSILLPGASSEQMQELELRAVGGTSYLADQTRVGGNWI